MVATKAESREAVDRLHEWVKPGDTLYTILRHVSRSGMSRIIDVVGIDREETGPDGSPRIWAFGWNVAKALRLPFDRDRDGVKISGCGMDMGFEVVYLLGRTLYPEGFECVGEGCPSNDHSNGDRDYSPHTHADGGYALRQRWL